MTNLTYNGIVIRNVLTKRFSQQLVMDESDTDAMYSKFTIRVTGLVTAGQRVLAPTVKTPGFETQPFNVLASNEVFIRRALMEARGFFDMKVGNVSLLKCDPTGANGLRDSTNGPKPRHVDVVAIHGTDMMRVEFEIEVCILECISPNAANGGVLNNRWSLHDEYSEDFYRTRTLEGRLRVQDRRFNPNLLRRLIIPTLQPGFKRIRIDILADRTGLEIAYTVVDKETYASPPGGCSRWECVETTSSGDYGTTWHKDFNIVLYGSPNQPREMLLRTAAIVATERLEIRKFFKKPPNNPKTTLVSFSLIDYLSENKVEVRMSAILNSGVDSKEVAGLPFPLTLAGKHIQDTSNLLGQFPNEKYDPKQNWDMTTEPLDVTGPISLAGLFVCQLQSPCQAQHGVPQLEKVPVPTYTTPPLSQYPPPVNISPGNLPPADLSQLDKDSLDEGVYTSYNVETEYRTFTNTVQLPIARSVSSTNQADQPSAFVVKLAPPTAKRYLVLTASRVANWPQLPIGKPANSNGVAIDLIGEGNIVSKTPRLLPDGKTRVYETRVEYEYALSRAPKTSENLYLGKLPWDGQSAAETILPGADVFSSELLKA